MRIMIDVISSILEEFCAGLEYMGRACYLDSVRIAFKRRCWWAELWTVTECTSEGPAAYWFR